MLLSLFLRAILDYPLSYHYLDERTNTMEKLIHPVPKSFSRSSHIDESTYQKMYNESITAPEKFWAEQAERLDWIKPWDSVKEASFQKEDVSIRWFEGAKINVAYNCVDRHAQATPNRTAIIWEGDDPEVDKKITYSQLKDSVCKMANVLKKHGVKKGDRVTIYMPMVLEAAYAMLACARIGAIHSIVFGGFSPDSLADRIIDCESSFLITADEGVRGNKTIPLKANVDRALERCPDCTKVLVVTRTGASVGWRTDRDIRWEEEAKTVSSECEPEPMDSEDPLFILYTSGSTGKPKGVLHSTAGYLLYASLTHETVFDYHE